MNCVLDPAMPWTKCYNLFPGAVAVCVDDVFGVSRFQLGALLVRTYTPSDEGDEDTFKIAFFLRIKKEAEAKAESDPLFKQCLVRMKDETGEVRKYMKMAAVEIGYEVSATDKQKIFAELEKVKPFQSQSWVG